MKSKLMSVFMAISLLFTTCATSTAYAASSEYLTTANVRVHYDSYVIGNSINSDYIVNDTIDLNVIINTNQFSFSGSIFNTPVNVNATVNNGNIISMEDSNGKYEILSLQKINATVRIVMKDVDAFNIYFIDMNIPDFNETGIENYRQNWYTDFITANITETTNGNSRSITTDYYKEFNNTTTIYSDTIKECLKVICTYEWDRSFSGTGDFKFDLGVNENYTEYTPYGETTEIWSGSSLTIYDAYLLLATPEGDYISTIDTHFVGDYKTSSAMHVDYSLSIPNTGFSISWTLPKTTEIQNGNNGHFSFPGTTSNKTTQANVEWATTDYFCNEASSNGEDFGDYFEADVDIKYIDQYAIHNTTKGLSVRWDFSVYSNGNCNGVAVNSYVTSSYFSNTLYYTTT